MEKILLLNAGSSSVKWKVFAIEDEKIIGEGEAERINSPQASFTIQVNGEKRRLKQPNLGYEETGQMILQAIEKYHIASLDEIQMVGHRIVAGGQKFKQATLITPEVLEQLKSFEDFAPLHNPHEIRYVQLMQKILPRVSQYAVFDSIFFTDMPEFNAIYSLPYRLTDKYQIRRYGEHGISHSYLAERTAEILKRPLEKLKIITLHLGSGSSIAAIKNGKAYDSSMGFTPLPGLTMGTRAGDIDPSIVPFLMKKEKISANDVMNILNDESGLLGISGLSADMRDIEEAWMGHDHQATLARTVFINRVVKYVGAYFAELGGIDALVVAGGIGEHQIDLRMEIFNQLSILGIRVDERLNKKNVEGLLSPSDSQIKTLLIPTNEELQMVRQIKRIL